ncbi:hypothetical protein B296_00038757 [Ensete ventricosum]|uniref:Uncharacterized protein n=1 Tax=Ensete ventricosum TaxID=4639 RepID=A0A426ZSA2_ENSVE|nr:hypothetical protein B296_00038757 [Ensete ventricosum]
MASSVARIPSADEWHDPGRLAAAVFGAARGRTSFTPANLKKVLVRQQQSKDVPSSSSSSSTLTAAGDSVAGEEDGASRATARRRQSQIHHRWAVQQAREMVTTIDRHAHQAEISTLTTTSQPVSVRAASLLREASPSPSECSAGSAAVSSSGAGAGAGDLPPNVRASSLIQMWRELEAEAGLTPKHRTACGGGNMENASAASFSADEPSGCNSDFSDESDAFVDWNSDMTTTANTSTSCSLNDNEKSRVGSIVKMLSSGHGARRFMATLNNENEPSGRDNPVATKKTERFRSTVSSSVLSPRRLRGRGEMENLVATMEKERRRELAALAEHQHVSRFPYGGRLQVKLRHRFFYLISALVILEFGKLELHPNVLLDRQNTRERFNNRGQHWGGRKRALESSSSAHVQFPMDAEDTVYKSSEHVQFPMDAEDTTVYKSSGHVQFPMDAEGSAHTYSSDNNQYQEIVIHPQIAPPETNTSSYSRSDYLQEGIQSVDGSWDERNLWVTNLDWQRPGGSLPSNGWHGEAVAEELESYPQQNASNWISRPSDPWTGGWGASRKPAAYHDLFKNFSDNVEIRELLERYILLPLC